MSDSLASIKVHLVFGTKERVPWLTPDIRGECYQRLAALARKSGSKVYEIGGVCDHVHILLTLPKTLSIAKLVEVLKSTTAKWLKGQRLELESFCWQSGYGAFSVSESQVERVRQYIRNQEAHHQKVSFQNEFDRIARSNG
ncbi:MAG: IS200/IS605 family transposase [Myxococcota bacterium]